MYAIRSYYEPTPRAMTGKVATLIPIPSATIRVSQRKEVISRGIKATITARQFINVIKHNTITDA